jgi:DinB superfamily
MSAEMSIEPDSKDWTWVIDRRCEECGFDPRTVDHATIADRLVTAAQGWPARLAQPDARERPAPHVWSPLEYGAHVRDLAGLMARRLTLILDEDDPLFPDWDQDAAAIDGSYATLSPEQVADELVDAVTAFADVVRTVPPRAWDRAGTRSNGSVFTAYTISVYALHDVEHHVHDVGPGPG